MVRSCRSQRSHYRLRDAMLWETRCACCAPFRLGTVCVEVTRCATLRPQCRLRVLVVGDMAPRFLSTVRSPTAQTLMYFSEIHRRRVAHSHSLATTSTEPLFGENCGAECPWRRPCCRLHCVNFLFFSLGTLRCVSIHQGAAASRSDSFLGEKRCGFVLRRSLVADCVAGHTEPRSLHHRVGAHGAACAEPHVEARMMARYRTPTV